MVKKDDIVELRIENLAYGGRGIGKREGMVIFVSDAVPGDHVKARVIKDKSNYAEAALQELIEPSPLRIRPRCPIFEQCGGCCWQNLSYDKQLVFKEQIVKSTLEHLGRQYSIDINPIIGSPEIWHYRNKMEFTFGQQGEDIILGFHKPGSFLEMINVEKCFLHPPEFDQILGIIRAFCQERNLEPYNTQTRSGLLRHVILRKSKKTDSIMVMIITARPELPEVEKLAERLSQEIKNLQGFIWGLNQGVSDVARMEKVLFKQGDDFLIEGIDNVQYKVSAFSFFQPNTLAAEHLYRIIKDFLELTGRENLFDAYCGVGSIGLYCADRAKHVFGIEMVTQAVWDARYNAMLNSFDNCLFLAGAMHETLSLLVSHLGQDSINRVVMDPPRGGMDRKSLRAILELAVPLLVYVSCNPAILSRDLITITQAGYKIETVQPIDLFPHTYHVETVVKLRKD